MHEAEIKPEGHGDALAVVVAAANNDGVDAAALTHKLSIQISIAIHLTAAGKQQLRPYTPR